MNLFLSAKMFVQKEFLFNFAHTNLSISFLTAWLDSIFLFRAKEKNFRRKDTCFHS
jgi:hypothetical protein